MLRRLTALLTAMVLLLSVYPACAKSKIPTIPEGTLKAQTVTLPSNQLFTVYSAPDDTSLRGAKSRACVSTNDWIQIFGYEGEWVMVQYDIRNSRYRIGYIERSVLPEDLDIDIPRLRWTNIPMMTTATVKVTDDPLKSEKALTTLPEGTVVTRLTSLEEWTYVEGYKKGRKLRGFVHTKYLASIVSTLGEAEAILVGSWRRSSAKVTDSKHYVLFSNGTVYGTYSKGSGDSADWAGKWSVRECEDPSAYINDPEFELVLDRGTETVVYGLRIGVQQDETNGYSYLLVLSDDDDYVRLTLGAA